MRCEVCEPVERSLQEGAVSFCTHTHLGIMVGDASFTQAVSTQLTVHGKEDMLLSAFPEPVILCPLAEEGSGGLKGNTETRIT